MINLRKEKGVTLITLLIYILLTLTALAMLTVISSHFRNNLKNLDESTVKNSELDKLNMQFVNETKTLNNKIISCEERKVIFKTSENENVYTYNSEDQTIYLNNNIKIATGFSFCKFNIITDGSRQIFKVTLNFEGKRKEIEYIISLEENAIKTNGEWENVKGVNSPKLGKGMFAIYWNETGEEISQDDDNFVWEDWYDYIRQDLNEDGKSKWANAKTEDGSYWVWIPRFEYKIIEPASWTPSATNAGKIDVKFIPTSQTAPDEGYTIHPAFITDVNLGGFGKETSGFWVAKYEMSQEKLISGTWTAVTMPTDDVTAGQKLGEISTSNTIRMVSKPSRNSWRYIDASYSYTNSYNYDRENDSHLIKNSQWGALAYLTHSQYGRNGKEVGLNACLDFYTGAGPIAENSNITYNYSENNFENTYAWNTNLGKLASSTGNLTGVYDLSGCTAERVAVFNKSGNSLDSGSAFATASSNSTKYATAYKNSTEQTYIGETAGKSYLSFQEFSKAGYIVSILGDGIQEIHMETSQGWFADKISFLSNSNCFLLRGGRSEQESFAGIFSAADSNGGLSTRSSFRVVLIR